jgi:hypothetical protein
VFKNSVWAAERAWIEREESRAEKAWKAELAWREGLSRHEPLPARAPGETVPEPCSG